jgi:hypothetical protein
VFVSFAKRLSLEWSLLPPNPSHTPQPRLIRTLPDITPGTGVRTVLLPHPDAKCKAASGRGKRQAETPAGQIHFEPSKTRKSLLGNRKGSSVQTFYIASFYNSAISTYLLFRLSFPTSSSYFLFLPFRRPLSFHSQYCPASPDNLPHLHPSLPNLESPALAEQNKSPRHDLVFSS